MALTINHQTNDISATSGSMTIDGAAVGGGGGGADPDLYRDNASSATTPVASGTNAVAVGHDSVASANRAMAFGASTDATAGWSCALGNGAQAGGENSVAIGSSRATGSEAVAIGIGGNSSNGATGSASIAMGNSASASGQNSVAIGKGSVSTGTRSLAVGTSRAAGNYSVAMMIGSNSTSYGTYGGSRNLAMGELARSTFGSYALGAQARAEGEKSYVIGTESTADKKRSMAFGYQSQPASEDTLSFAGGQFSSKGDGQRSFAALRCSTTNANPATLTTNDNGNVSSNNQIILPNNSAFAFTGTLIAREQASSGTDVGAWKVEGTIRREGSAGTTTLIHNTVTAIGTAPSGWSLAITADTTYGAAKFAVTGAASTNIRWVLKLDTAEVSYA